MKKKSSIISSGDGIIGPKEEEEKINILTFTEKASLSLITFRS